ncbi:hypothetical protein K7X08_014879 [Anisodus acutangulus]|uniref:BUB1 N-terminal domain-containing protein n=1 Tax=Anisodus acutangulus TaxID=402998 RepID=A0A9Q1LKK0_9SOLA|nr:hypothetical protein K7X08_014879 [Anisodus acutangulus]
MHALISVYVRCASSSPLASSLLLMNSASKLFYEMPERDDLSWTTIITGYVKNDDLDAARKVFDGMDEKLLVAWNAMISGYVHKGFIFEALDMLRKMYLAGMKPDEFTCTSILSACADAGLFLLGKQEIHVSVHNALITLYWKCGRVDEARKVFDNLVFKDLVWWNAVLSAYMPEKNSLAWTVMISGFAQNGRGEESLKLFNQMRVNRIELCDYAFAGAITSCAVLATLETGCQLHAQLIQRGFDSSLSAGNALITFYGRSGVIEAARTVFLTIPCVDLAENCMDAEVIYSFLEANKIGVTHSSFYIAYALHMESQNKIKTANEIFNRGLSMNAEPEEKLKVSYKKFLSRSMGCPKAAEEELAEHQHPMRSFGTLLARREARNQTTGTSEFPRKKMKQDR